MQERVRVPYDYPLVEERLAHRAVDFVVLQLTVKMFLAFGAVRWHLGEDTWSMRCTGPIFKLARMGRRPS